MEENISNQMHIRKNNKTLSPGIQLRGHGWFSPSSHQFTIRMMAVENLTVLNKNAYFLS